MDIFKKIRFIVNNYGMFFIAFALCFAIYSFINTYVVNFLSSKNIDKFFQATITCTSILLGFSGTLITQILLSKREFEKMSSNSSNTKENKLMWFFKIIDSKTLINTILISLGSSITLIISSLFMLISDVLDINVRIFVFYLWLYIFIIFVFYEIGLYRLFISLLFENEEKQFPMIDSEDLVARQACINAINEQNHS